MGEVWIGTAEFRVKLPHLPPMVEAVRLWDKWHWAITMAVAPGRNLNLINAVSISKRDWIFLLDCFVSRAAANNPETHELADVRMYFTDGHGIRWCRTGEGRLEEVRGEDVWPHEPPEAVYRVPVGPEEMAADGPSGS